MQVGESVIYRTQNGVEYYADIIGTCMVGKNRKGGAITDGFVIRIVDFTREHRDHLRATVPGWTHTAPKSKYTVRRVAQTSVRPDKRD